MDNRRRERQSGVTLIEMLVVVTIIALFAAYVGMRLWPQADRARVTATRAQIGSFMSALDTYKMDVGVFPTTEQGLQALRVRPPIQRSGAARTWPRMSRSIHGDVPTSTGIRAKTAKIPRSSPTAPTASLAARASTRTL